MNQNPQEILLISIEKALSFSEKGQTKKAQELLRFIYEITLKYPYLLWDNTNVWKLGKCFLILYHYDMFDNEEQNLQLTKFAYIYNYRAISLLKKSESEFNQLFNAFHSQSVLLSTCNDCFVHFIAQLYSHANMSNEEYNISIKLARRVMPIISYDVLIQNDEIFPNFKNDSFLQELCNTLELENPDITENQLVEAGKIQKLLYQYFVHEFSNK